MPSTTHIGSQAIMSELNQFSVFLFFFTVICSGFMIRAWIQEFKKLRRDNLNRLYAECGYTGSGSQFTEGN